MDPRKAPKTNLLYRTAQVRATDDGSGFDGHASTWWVVDSYGTAMKPGAFKKTLKERGSRVPLLWQHWPDVPIGKPTTLAEDETGLAFTASVAIESRAGAEAMALLRADVPLGMSFGFQTVKDRPIKDADHEYLDWSQADPFYTSDDGRQYVRIIEEVKLWEISLVTFPANESATISAVRADAEAEVLSSLLDAIKTNRLDETRVALVDQVVAAWQQRAEPEAVITDLLPLTPNKARRDRDIAIVIARAKALGYGVSTV